MRSSLPLSKRLTTYQWLWLFLLPLLTFLGTLLSGFWLFGDTVFGSLVSMIVNIGLDQQRALFVSALLMTAGAALIGAFVGRRKLGAVLGAGFVFWFSYLSPFIGQQMLPQRDAVGLPMTLNQDVLNHTSLVMSALGLLCGFIGSAVGISLAQTLLDPLFSLAMEVYQHHAPRRILSIHLSYIAINRPRWLSQTVWSWVGTLCMLGVLILSTQSSDLFVYTPDTGIHTSPHHGKIGTADNNTNTKVQIAGTIHQDMLTSTILNGQKRSLWIYLPPTYDSPVNRNKHYPVIYLLHGSPGASIDWFKGGKADQSTDELTTLGRIQDTILVLPDGNGRRGATSEWANSGDGKQRIEDYMVDEVVPYVDQKYRTISDPDYRAIGGLSMGGFGATNIAIHHPDRFGFVISLGGYYRVEGTIWGQDTTYKLLNSPTYTLKKEARAQKLRMYIGAATQDQPYYNYAKSFVEELKQLKIPHTFDVETGRHSWKVWQVQFAKSLLWLKWGPQQQAAATTSLPTTLPKKH